MREAPSSPRAVRDAQRLAAVVAAAGVVAAAAVALSPAPRAEAGSCRPAAAPPAGVHAKRTWGKAPAVSLWIGVEAIADPRC